MIRRNGIHIPPPNFRPIPSDTNPMNFAAAGKVPTVPQQPGQQNYPPQPAAPAQAAPSSPAPAKKEPLNRSASSEEVIYVTQEELEKLKAEGHDDEFVVYSEEQDDKPAAVPKQSSSPVPTTTTTVRPVTVKASPQPPVVPSQQTIRQQPQQQQQKTDLVSNIEYDNSVELITGSPIEFIDYSKPRDIVVKTSFSHGGSPANAPPGPTIPHSKPKHQGNFHISEY